MALDGACADPNRGVDAVVVLCPQNVRVCYCMRITFAYVFFAFAAKLHFVCIFTVCPVPPSWLRHGGGYSVVRVEHPFLRKSCFLHRRGAHFQNITFLGPVEKGNRDVVNHMPWRTATRHCVHSVMPLCTTPSVASIALALL